MSVAGARRRRGAARHAWTACAAALLTAACARPSGPSPAAAAPISAGAAAPPAASGPPVWTTLPALRPLWTATNRPGLAPDPYDPALLAVCPAGGGALVSRDGGATWSSISTAGVAQALAADHLSAGPGCVGALPDPRRPGTVYAAFPAAASPPFDVGAYTTDGGATWRLAGTPLPRLQPSAGAGPSASAAAPALGTASGTPAKPLPPPVDPSGFGGFRPTPAGAVQALFTRAGAAAAGVVVSQTGDGGATWTAAQLACPAQGPCARWGPPAPGACGASATLAQSVLAGPVWRALDAGTDACHAYELAGASGGTLALVSAATLLRLSTDGGSTWSAVALPAVPGLAQGAPAAAVLLPDGSLLVVGNGWPEASSPRPLYLLRAGAAVWCPVPGVSIAPPVRDLTLAGPRLWWLSGAAAEPSSVAAASLHC